MGREITLQDAEALQQRHGELFAQLLPERRPLPGAIELLRFLRSQKVAYGIATSGRHPEIGLLTGGYGEEELSRAGAFRVYRDPSDLYRSLDELGLLP